MTWIDDRIEQGRETSRRNGLIAAEAERTYDVLWQEIGRFVEEAQLKQIKVLTNGSVYERIVVIPASPRKELRVVLKKYKQLIAVNGDIESPFDLVFDIRPDNIVCLKKDGIEVNPEAAAQLILDPFLFPGTLPLQSRHTKIQDISTLRDGTY